MLKNLFKNWYWVDRPRRKRENPKEDNLFLFRAIKRKHQWWRFNIGDYWSSEPYMPIQSYMGDKGGLYIALMSENELIRLEAQDRLSWCSLSGTLDGMRNKKYICQLHPGQQKFLWMRKVSQQELAHLTSPEFRTLYEQEICPPALLEQVFPVAHQKV